MKERQALVAEAQIDKRIRRTKAALREAFVDLVLSKSYDDIKVNEIIENAGIGRSTFYQHYNSKDDILASSLEGPMAIIADTILSATSTERLKGLLLHFWDKRRFARVIFTGTSRKHVLTLLTVKLGSRVENYCQQNNRRCLIPVSMVSTMVAEAQMVLILSWLTGKGSCSIDQIVEALDKVSKSFLPALIEN